MPTLRRLEWWHNDSAERTGGINSLSGVIRGCPKLEYLFLCGNSDYSRLRMECRQLVLPTYTPLSQVIVDSPIPEHGLDTLWEAFGRQLRTVEFGKHLRFLLSDNIPSCLEQCPHLSEFNYYLFFTCVPHIREPHESVTNIGLHAAVNAFLDERMAWEHIERHFSILTGTAFPALRSITMYGNWQGIVSHPCFPALRERVYNGGRVLIEQ
ncbi:hypothetical protein BDQ17DRAFT_1345402, partial [Cyathus striatus]